MHRTAPTFTTLLMVQTNMFAQHRATVPLTSATTATIVPHASDSSTAHKDHAKGRCRSPVCLPRSTQHPWSRSRCETSLLASWCHVGLCSSHKTQHPLRAPSTASPPPSSARQCAAGPSTTCQTSSTGPSMGSRTAGDAIENMHSRGAWPALSRFCEGGREKLCFFALGVSTR